MVDFYVKIVSNGGPEILGASSSEILQREFLGHTQSKENAVEFTVPDNFVCFSNEDARRIAQYVVQNNIPNYQYCGLLVHNFTADKGAKSTTVHTIADTQKHSNTDSLCHIGAHTVFPCIEPSDIARAAEIIRERIVQRTIDSGTIIYCPQTVTIGFFAKIEPSCVIYQNNYIAGKSVVGSKTQLLPNNIITDTNIAENCRITSSTLTGAQVGEGSSIGPNAYLRPDSVIGRGCRIGDFVEVKNSRIGDGTKIAHLSYVGDAELGKNINIGCGVVFVNYDGKNKNRIFVGDNSFIGCNSNLIAPLNINSNCYIAAGTTVTQDLQKGDFCIGRSRQTVKPEKAYSYLKSNKDKTDS